MKNLSVVIVGGGSGLEAVLARTAGGPRNITGENIIVPGGCIHV